MSESTTGAIEVGYCHCGCGGRTSLARDTDRTRGYERGKPVRYISGHAQRAKAVAEQADRFFARVNKTDTCWLWTGATNGYGYGRMELAGKRIRAHRWSYEYHVGPIPEGLVLDHLCRVRNCVNPAHLEPVTNAENVRRGEPANRTHCPAGHEYTPENTRLVTDPSAPYPFRRCRTCHKARCKARRDRITAASLLADLAATREADQGAREKRALGGDDDTAAFGEVDDDA